MTETDNIDMKHTVPLLQERKFDIQDLFFSTTNDKGRIEFGNDVFVKISGFSKEDLVGAPHNIIRHPDMPKIVFKILWETIQSGKIIAAYVKNMAKDGSFYWVMAVVFPVGDRYLSVRLKPTSPYRNVIEDAYKQILEVEKKDGVEAARNFLNSLLDSLGFKNYEEFSVKALLAEIVARDSELKRANASKTEQGFSNEILRLISEESKAASKYTEEIFIRISELEKSNSVFSGQTKSLNEKFYDFQLLSLNIQVFSSKIGEQGRSLSVIAQNFNTLVSNVSEHLGQFAIDAKKIDDANLIFTKQICALKLLTDMVDFFVQETLHATNPEESQKKINDLSEISTTFTSLARALTNAFSATRLETFKLIEKFSELNKDTRKLVNGIELVSQIGYIESARITSQEVDFKHSIDTMKKFSEILRDSLHIINQNTGSILDNLSTFDAHIEECYQSVSKIFSYSLEQRKDL